jgi:hypothetical protein
MGSEQTEKDFAPAENATFRALSIEGMAAIARGHEPGPPPRLEWIALADCVIDETYQRPISRAGVTNLRRIAAEFSWSRFSPLIVAPTPFGKWAIIDGQHRATAALLLGYERAPAQIVDITQREQAAAFRSVNGNVTRPHALGIFHAAVAGGDALAVSLNDAAVEAGVRIMPYPREKARLNLNETLAHETMRRIVKRWGRTALVLTLKCMTQTRHNRIGVINQWSVRSIGSAIGPRRDWQEQPAAVIAAIDTYDKQEFADWIDSCSCSADCAAFSEELSEFLANALPAQLKGPQR